MNKSPEIKNLAAAMAKFQAEMEAVKKDSINPYFKSKYADLASIIEAIKKPMTANGLSYSQFPCGPGGLTTILMHTSGEWIEDTFTMEPVDRKPQSVGSALTYARRYALGAVLGLATEEDDDGNAASKGKEDSFSALLQLVEKSGATELKELEGKMQKSSKYTAEQKAEFAAAAAKRLAAIGAKKA